MPSKGEKFGIKTGKTLRRVNPREVMEEVDKFAINICQDVEAEVLFGENRDLQLQTNLYFEKVNKNERKR